MCLDDGGRIKLVREIQNDLLVGAVQSVILGE